MVFVHISDFHMQEPSTWWQYDVAFRRKRESPTEAKMFFKSQCAFCAACNCFSFKTTLFPHVVPFTTVVIRYSIKGIKFMTTTHLFYGWCSESSLLFAHLDKVRESGKLQSGGGFTVSSSFTGKKCLTAAVPC